LGKNSKIEQGIARKKAANMIYQQKEMGVGKHKERIRAPCPRVV
jgi:hypothetical protein